MRGVTGTRHVGIATAITLATVLTAAGCGTESDPAGSGGKNAPSKTPADSLAWEFEHIADFSGELSDIAVLAKDDIWAVGTENNGESNAHLVHYDGTEWKREPLPPALADTDYPPQLEEVGEKALWLRPQNYNGDTGVSSWASWDGTGWSKVPSPPPGEIEDFEAAGPDDVWALDSERTAQHWDGTRWTTTKLPYRTVDLAIVGPDDAWAVGSRETGPGTDLGEGERYSQPASMHWNGTSWKSVQTPQARFEEPLPPEPSANLEQVFALDSGEVRAYGNNTFNHGEVENEPADERVQLRWTGSKWVDQKRAPGECEERTPVGQDERGLFLQGNWFLTNDGQCTKIERKRLPLSTGARKGSNQSLWLEELHRVPGTNDWLGAGHVQVNQSGDPFDAPVVVRLKRGE